MDIIPFKFDKFRILLALRTALQYMDILTSWIMISANCHWHFDNNGQVGPSKSSRGILIFFLGEVFFIYCNFQESFCDFLLFLEDVAWSFSGEVFRSKICSPWMSCGGCGGRRGRCRGMLAACRRPRSPGTWTGRASGCPSRWSKQPGWRTAASPSEQTPAPGGNKEIRLMY